MIAALWLIGLAWIGWAAQVWIGDWARAWQGGSAAIARARPTTAALFGLSNRWVITIGSKRAWLCFDHERVALAVRGERGRQVTQALDPDTPCAIGANTIIRR